MVEKVVENQGAYCHATAIAALPVGFTHFLLGEVAQLTDGYLLAHHISGAIPRAKADTALYAAKREGKWRTACLGGRPKAGRQVCEPDAPEQ